MAESFFSELLAQLTERGRALFPKQRQILFIGHEPDIVELCLALLSRRGEASGVALATEILRRWDEFDSERKKEFLLKLVEDFGSSVPQLEAAIQKWQRDPSEASLRAIHSAAEPRRQELIRRLNLAPEGTRKLVLMREEIFAHRKQHPELDALDADFVHLFSSWFNRGFLVLKRIDWTTSASILEKIIRYEAVHAIDGWTELRRRIEPEDRRLFAFFHPQMNDEPLIFVEVALTHEIPDSISPLLAADRRAIPASDAETAVFYSISNCQEGLRGVSFGNFLIKQVVEDLKYELPNLKTFVTLSPAPGFSKWLAAQSPISPDWLPVAEREALADLQQSGWAIDKEGRSKIAAAVEFAASFYFLNTKNEHNKPVDPVARFHLGNGARLERLNPLGDTSPNGIRQSQGLMVNYLYDLESIEANHERFAETGEVITSKLVRSHLRSIHGVQKPIQRISA
jgi:malonyl-CoA decarboxylase